MNTILEQLKNKRLVWQANQQQQNSRSDSSGYQELDELLQGGFVQTGVVDVDSPIGIGELRLLLPLLYARHQSKQRLLVFIAPPMQVNGEMFAHCGFDLSNLLVVQPHSAAHALWSAEQCLKSGVCHSVLLWHQTLEVAQVKRLQLAAQQGEALQFIFRHHHQLQLSLPVCLAMKLRATEQGIGVQVTKRKGGWPKQEVNICMRQHWPALTFPEHTDNVVAFARSKVS